MTTQGVGWASEEASDVVAPPLNLVLYMNLRIFVYTSNVLIASFEYMDLTWSTFQLCRWITVPMANPTVTVIQHLGKKSIQTNRDSADVLRHIIKNVSSRLVGTIQSPAAVTNGKTFFFLSARIIGAHASTIKTLLSSSSAGSTEWRRMRQDSRSKSGRRTLTHHGHLSLS
jgi:hypothetical protein